MCVFSVYVHMCRNLHKPEEGVYICILNPRERKWPVSCDYILGNQNWRGNCEIYLKVSYLSCFISLSRLVAVSRSLVDLPVYTFPSPPSYGSACVIILYFLRDFLSLLAHVYWFLFCYPLTFHVLFNISRLFLLSNVFIRNPGTGSILWCRYTRRHSLACKQQWMISAHLIHLGI